MWDMRVSPQRASDTGGQQRGMLGTLESVWDVRVFPQRMEGQGTLVGSNEECGGHQGGWGDISVSPGGQGTPGCEAPARPGVLPGGRLEVLDLDAEEGDEGAAAERAGGVEVGVIGGPAGHHLLVVHQHAAALAPRAAGQQDLATGSSTVSPRGTGRGFGEAWWDMTPLTHLHGRRLLPGYPVGRWLGGLGNAGAAHRRVRQVQLAAQRDRALGEKSWSARTDSQTDRQAQPLGRSRVPRRRWIQGAPVGAAGSRRDCGVAGARHPVARSPGAGRRWWQRPGSRWGARCWRPAGAGAACRGTAAAEAWQPAPAAACPPPAPRPPPAPHLPGRSHPWRS